MNFEFSKHFACEFVHTSHREVPHVPFAGTGGRVRENARERWSSDSYVPWLDL